MFAMSGDGKQDVQIPMVFLFHKEGTELLEALERNPDMEVVLTYKAIPKGKSYQPMIGPFQRYVVVTHKPAPI